MKDVIAASVEGSNSDSLGVKSAIENFDLKHISFLRKIRYYFIILEGMYRYLESNDLRSYRSNSMVEAIPR